MFALIPFTFGNRRPDAHGNVHSRWDDDGSKIVIKLPPPGYMPKHRAPEPDVRPIWWWERPLQWLARLAGESV